ncbi:hypothetical protein PIB30_061467 [Stylosanthes scabra]|uniref:Uncharacterized protein n=1 Tax=Stylosanthes scabra TaxID=79078 RepID=A0ABU6VN91_9FABA|nr:hypothetical protein [Stylosanthes scabra]
MVRQSELQCGSYDHRKAMMNSVRVDSEATLNQFLNQLSAQLTFANEKERENGAPFIAINEWQFRNFVVWSVPGQIFNVCVRIRVLNISVTAIIPLFSLRFIPDGIKPSLLASLWKTRGGGVGRCLPIPSSFLTVAFIMSIKNRGVTTMVVAISVSTVSKEALW